MRERIEEARAASERSDHAAARAMAAEAVERLLALPEEEQRGDWLSLLERAADTASSAQDPRTARRAWERVVEARARSLPEDHPDLQRARIDLGRTLEVLGDLHGSRALGEQVLEVFSRTLPPDHLDVQEARQRLGVTLARMGDSHGARALLEEVLGVLTRTLDPDHPRLSAVRLNLAVVLERSGDFEGARALEELALEVLSRTQPLDHPQLQTARQNLAATLSRLGDLHGARALEEQVLEFQSRTLPPDHPSVQSARQNLGITLFALGELPGARALFEQVLEVTSRALPHDHPRLQGARQNLAAALSRSGDLQGARALEEAVLEVRSRILPPDHADLQSARLNLAWTLFSMGDAAGARALQEAALEVFSRSLTADHPDLQDARANLASTLLMLGDVSGARELEEQVLEVRSRTLPPSHPHLQGARTNLARTLKRLGDLQRARELLEETLEVVSRTLPPDSAELQLTRRNLALTIGDQIAIGPSLPGESEQASRRCAELLGAIAGARVDAVRATMLSSSRREVEERVAWMGRELDVALSFASGYGALAPMPELAPALFAYSESSRGAALVAAELMRAGGDFERNDELRRALSATSKKLASLARSGTGGEEFRETVAERDGIERELLAFARESLGLELPSLGLDPLQVSDALEAGSAAIAYRSYQRSSVSLSADPAPHQPASALVPSRVQSLCAFVVRGGQPPGEQVVELVDLGPLEPIEAGVAAWREALGVGEGRGIGVEPRPRSASLEALGDDLRARVLDPLLSALGDARRVVLVLDDVLHLVPFDALPAGGTDGAQGERVELLGQRFQLEVRGTLGELFLRQSNTARGSLLAVGGASYWAQPLDPDGASAAGSLAAEATIGASPEDPHAEPSAHLAALLRGSAFERGFGPLPHSGLEARELAALHDSAFGPASSNLLLGSRASRAALDLLAPRARWLHVATHGWYAAESIRSWLDPEPLDIQTGLGARRGGEAQVRGSSPMLLCGLALAGANLPEDALGRAPGLITAEELSTLDLTGCELAVLSACDTNIGQRRAGQGVASLQRALHMAGARSVITSLWKVPDEATSELMLDFYRRLWVEKKPKHQALWEAKLRLRHARDERGEPLYTTRDWAAWVLTGEPE